MGFWVGLLLWSINPYTQLFSFDYSPITAFLLGCVGSGASYILTALFDDDGFQVG